MANYSVSLTSSAAKELEALPKKLLARIYKHIENLELSPRPTGHKKLKGGDKEYRVRIGDYRVIYEIDDTKKTVDVTRIAHRKDVYR
ncbi:MAG: type II toxin-antitoxin system RelE/ParE family toxin [Alphaproteobacteria bacterium]|nr:type II toxin-antitoxin system RelE/ParE family toxin [Alphaproteobacteria bacterium]